MKKSLVVLFCLWLLVISSSCKWLMVKVYGISQPRYESVKRVVKKSKQFQLDTAGMLVMNPYSIGSFYKRGIPEGEIFDANGRYLEYKATDTSCNAGLFGFISQLKADSHYLTSNNRTLNKEMDRFRRLDGLALTENYFKPADFYVFLTWAIWIGRLNKDHVKEWEQLVKKNPKAKIQLVLVNIDLRKEWNTEEKDFVEKVLTKKKK